MNIYLRQREAGYSYNPRQKVLEHFPSCNIFQGNFSVRPLPPNSMLFIVMNSSLLVYNIVWGGGGVPILVMSFGIVSKIPCEHIFVLSDPGVPRTFVMDCSLQLF